MILINGVPARCILDTGAETSMISSQFYHGHLAKVVGELDDVGGFFKLMGANHLEIPLEGYLETQVEILGQRFCASFVVSSSKLCPDPGDKSSKYPVLLGCNILRKVASNAKFLEVCRPNSDWDLAIRWFRSMTSAGADVGVREPVTTIFDVLTRGEETIQPRTVREIHCVLGGSVVDPQGRLMLVQPYPISSSLDEIHCGVRDLEGACHIVEGLQQVDGPHLSLLFANTSPNPLVVPPSTKIGTASDACLTEQVVVDSIDNCFHVSVHNVVAGVPDVTDVDAESSGPVGSESPGHGGVQGSCDQQGELFVFPDGTEFLLPPGISLRSLNATDALSAAELIRKHQNVFSKGQFDLGYCDLIPHEIHLSDERLINLPYRRVIPSQISEVKKLLQDLLDRKIIRRSASPYASPIVLVRKRDGQLRLCVDYRCLNAKTHRDAFPLPRIDETLESLGGAKLFSSLDLAHGYFQVAMHPDSVAKTAFRVPWGLYEFLRLPQGLCNSPSTFQRIMELIFGDMNLSECVLYLDDLLVFSDTFEEHLRRLDKVLSRLETHGLKLKGTKCQLFRTSVTHLGHIVSDQGIAVDPTKIERVRDWPTPTKLDQLRSFLGLASYYRRYVKGFAKIAAPLHALSGKAPEKVGNSRGTLPWSEEADEAFQTLKSALCSTPVLAYPQFDRDFVLEVDASLKGLGACLSQRDDSGCLHPVAYASRGLRGAERNYSDLSSFKLELLALKWAVSEKFREYLWGRHTLVLTDNSPVAHLQTAKLGATEQRWAAQLAPFDLEIRYRSGRSNKCADALSRNPPEVTDVGAACVFQTSAESTSIPVELRPASADHSGCAGGVSASDDDAPLVTPSVFPSYSHSDLAAMQKQDEALGVVWGLWNRRWDPGQGHADVDSSNAEVKGWVREWSRLIECKGVLYRSVEDPGLGQVTQLLVPKRLRRVILEASHDQWGHQGVGRTLNFIRRRCFWPGMSCHVREHIRNCYHCTVSKAPTPTVRPPMRHLLAFRPLERLAIDFLKLDRGHGNYEDVLVMTDSFTKFAVAVACKDQTAPTVARVLRDEWFTRYGVPAQIHSDRGRNFESHLVQEICDLYGIKKTRTSPYHAQGNGQTERFNKTLCGLIKSLDSHSRSKWPELLPYLVFMYNSTPHCVTGFTPYTLMFGREPLVPLDQLISNTGKSWSENVAQQQATFLKRAHKLVKDRMISAAAANKQRYDKLAQACPLPIGSRVLVKRCAFTDRHKLSNHFCEEQYIVVKRNSAKDLYAVRPALGGPERWLNRKMLVLDPRGELTQSGDPFQKLPTIKDCSDSDTGSTSDDSEDELLIAVPGRLSDRADKSVAKLPSGEEAVPQPKETTGPRRSERLRQKCQSSTLPTGVT